MNHQSTSSKNNMTTTLDGKSGDEFDEAFIAKMIVHHQGAIDMAKLAEGNAKHDDVKSLANEIVAAQSKEISQLRDWQAQWGYDPSPGNEPSDNKAHNCC